MEVETLAGLFAVALIAGILDAISGGGGLITLPALLIAGVPPANALATNKIQALSSVVSSAIGFLRAGYIDYVTIRPKIVVAIIGAGIGACAVRVVAADFLKSVSPFILIGVALFFLFSGNATRRNVDRRIKHSWLSSAIVLPISFYDGFFGPGTGAMYVAALVLMSPITLEQATAETKVLNATGSAIAAIIFLPGSIIVWPAAIAMAVGAAVGGHIGAMLAIKWGAPFIRIAVVIVSVALALRLILGFA